jgi:hypothetical protein
MKKIFLSLTFLFSMALIGAAQTATDDANTGASTPKFRIGVKAGGGVGKISASSFENKAKLGGFVGGFGELRLSSLLDIQPEINANTLNTTTVATQPNVLINGLKKTLYYIDVPVLLKVNVSSTLSFVAGPQISVVLNNPNGANGVQWYSNGKSGQYTFNPTNVSAVGGAQLSFGVVRIQARYIAGLSNIANYNIQTYAQRQSWKTTQMQLGIGYVLR